MAASTHYPASRDADMYSRTSPHNHVSRETPILQSVTRPRNKIDSRVVVVRVFKRLVSTRDTGSSACASRGPLLCVSVERPVPPRLQLASSLKPSLLPPPLAMLPPFGVSWRLRLVGGLAGGLAARDATGNQQANDTGGDDKDDAKDDNDTGLLVGPVLALGELVNSVAGDNGVDGGHFDRGLCGESAGRGENLSASEVGERTRTDNENKRKLETSDDKPASYVVRERSWRLFAMRRASQSSQGQKQHQLGRASLTN